MTVEELAKCACQFSRGRVIYRYCCLLKGNFRGAKTLVRFSFWELFKENISQSEGERESYKSKPFNLFILGYNSSVVHENCVESFYMILNKR